MTSFSLVDLYHIPDELSSSSQLNMWAVDLSETSLQ
jgi:hypothetical protein